MLFNSLVFLLFMALCYPAYLGLRRHLGLQNVLLLFASYIFYGYWDVRFLSLIIISTLVDFCCSLGLARPRISPGRRRMLLGMSVTANLGILAFFKYFGFFAESFSVLLREIGVSGSVPHLSIILPVGISFYTFQTMSYTIDVYRGEIPAERNLLRFAVFVSFFPQLVAGPIERAGRLLPQIRASRHISMAAVREGLWLVLWGFFLKVYLADNLAGIADWVFAVPEGLTAGDVVLGCYAFAFQIYGDFAGYSAIAIGLSKLMGIDLITNFRFPYFVASPRDFWQHWHISLSSWLRDYLYIPLGGSKRGPRTTCRNLLVTMGLGGLWHGAAWNFVIWGVYHGAMLVGHRLIGLFLATRPRIRMPRVVSVLLMFHFTCIGWLLFRAGSLRDIRTLISCLGNADVSGPRLRYFATRMVVFAGPVFALQLWQWCREAPNELPPGPGWLRAGVVLVLFYLTVCLGNFGTKQFIYFQF